MISYSQNLEDVILERVFSGIKTGFYVDVGAADPEFLSVTKWFYDRGWSGINIEPNEALYDKLVRERSRDINVKCGVGDSHKVMTFFEAAVGELSSFDPKARTSAEETGVTGASREVEIFTLAEVLRDHVAGRQIDFLKIDVEGWELEVLCGMDFAAFRPTICIVEATLPQTRTESHFEWEHILLDNNYTFAYFDGLNRFYIENSRLDLKKHFDLPPNLFDGFKVHQHVVAETDAHRFREAERGMRKLSEDLEKSNWLLSEARADAASAHGHWAKLQAERETLATEAASLRRQLADVEAQATQMVDTITALEEKVRRRDNAFHARLAHAPRDLARFLRKILAQ